MSCRAAQPRLAAPVRRVAAKALALCAIIGVAASSLLGQAFSASASSRLGVATPRRLAGQFVEVEELPRGMVCRAAYGEQGDREEWNPLPQWRGEKSYHPSRELQADENRQWYHFDAEGKTLGHLSQAIAFTLRGKDSPLFDPIRDVGAFVVVTNCEKVRVSGRKYHYKLYFRNLSFMPGHMKVERFRDLLKRFPERIIMRAVWGSMPNTKTDRRIFKDRLKLFVGPNHLYNHKNPVEYPMHFIKDCTFTQALNKKDRIEHFCTRTSPKFALKNAKKKEQYYSYRVEAYKNFLRQQFEKDGEEAAEKYTLEEFKTKAKQDRYERVYEEAGGADAKVVPPETNFYPGTQIPKKRISANYYSQGGGGKGR